jgi:hypothetical protein
MLFHASPSVDCGPRKLEYKIQSYVCISFSRVDSDYLSNFQIPYKVTETSRIEYNQVGPSPLPFPTETVPSIVLWKHAKHKQNVPRRHDEGSS